MQAEIDGTLRLTYQFEIGRVSLFHRSAWDAAREISLPDPIFAALSEAYARTDSHNASVETLFAVLGNPGYDTLALQAAVGAKVVSETRPLFDNARVALANHLGLAAPWTDRPAHWPGPSS